MVRERILIVVNGLRVFGGAETQSLLLAKSLVNQHGRDVHFLSFGEGEIFRSKIEDEGLTVKTIPLNFYCRRVEKLRALAKIIRYVRSRKIQAIIPFVAVPNKVIGKIWRWTGAEFACWNQRDEGRNLSGHPSERRWIRNMSAIVSNSYEGRDCLVKTYGLSQQDIKIIPNGVVRPALNPANNIRERLGLPEGIPLVTMVANIHGYKDHPALVEAWRQVLDQLPHEHQPVLVLAGEMGREAVKLKARAFELGLCDKLRFTGHVGNVHELIAASVLGVFSSNLEGCPNGVLEFMAQGLAVVGTDISGVRQALGDSHADICLIPPHRPDLFATGILRLLQDESLRSLIGDANRRRIEQDFSVEGMAQAFTELMDKI